MELVQIHTMEPLDAATVRRVLRDAIPADCLDPRGGLGVRQHGPWRPADQWAGAVERLVWTTTFEAPRDRFVRPEALPTLIRRQLARPHHPFHPGEAIARQLGGALLVHWSDAWQLVSTAVYRERRLRWSLLLQGAHGGREEDAPEEPKVEETPERYTWDSGQQEAPEPTSRLVRCDGVSVTVEAPVVWVPEGDRTGVLAAALAQFFREPLALDPGEQITLPDTLSMLTGPLVWLWRDGRWEGDPARPPAPRVAAGGR